MVLMVDDCLDEGEILDLVEGRLDDLAEQSARAHVHRCEACRELVGNVAAVLDEGSDLAPVVVEPADALMRGALIGRYTVLSREGTGGMGSVYAAYDPELDRRVAIKLVRTDLMARGDPERLRARMAREAKAMARLNHPNVVGVYDVGTLGDELFIAMEFVEGTTLAAWCRARPRSWREILEPFLAAGAGLAAAHRAGLVHRDFKPDNVLVGSDGRTRVSDFGLVHAQAWSTESGEGALDEPRSKGSPIGTPEYMAPEQRGVGPVDARADQYSFCRALHRALLAREDGSTDAPAWLLAALERGQRQRPEERFASMDALLEALVSDPGRARRRRLGAAALGAALVAAVGGALLLGRSSAEVCERPDATLDRAWDAPVRDRVEAAFAASDRGHAIATHRRVEEALEAYVADWSEMWNDACTATKVRGEQSEELFDLRMRCLDRRRGSLAALTELLADPATLDVDNAVVAVQRLPDVAACADVDALRAVVPLPDEPDTRARIMALFGEIDRQRARQYMVGDAKGGIAALEPIAAEAESIGYAPLVYAARSLLGDTQDFAGDRAASESMQLRALEAASAARDDRSIGVTLVKIVALVGVGERRFAEARLAGRIAEAALTRADAPPEDFAGLYSALGLLARLEGRYADAKDLHARALETLDTAAGASKAERAAERSNYAATLIALGEHEAADALLREALAMLEAELGPEHPVVAYVWNNLGINREALGDYDGAQRDLGRALEIWEHAYGPNHVMVADVLDNLSVAERKAGRLDAARRSSERALAVFETAVGAEHPERADAILNLGAVLHAQGHVDDAAAQVERALAIHETSLGPEHPDLAYDLTDLGGLRVDQGRVPEAIALLERALALREKGGGDEKLVKDTRAALERARAAHEQ